MDAIDRLVSRGVDHIYPNPQALKDLLRSGRKIRLYQGFDPTGAHLHIGHAVALRKLREFQDLGHQVIFLIGDFTAMIGDPTGKLSARKLLTREEVLANAEKYKEQAGKILRFDGENPAQIKYNSEWLGKLSAIDFLKLSHHVTYQQVVERDMFQARIKANQDIFMNEFLYPILQGYDSVAMDIDLEIGGSDQMFNMMMGRKLMRNIKQKEKFVMTVPLLADKNGVKIGKSEGNVIGLTDHPNDFYAKIMSLGDDAIIPCYTLLTDIDTQVIDEHASTLANGENPMLLKKKLAFTLTEQFSSTLEAQTAQETFERVVQHKEQPESIPTFTLNDFNTPVADILVQSEMSPNITTAKRALRDGIVSFNGHVLKSGDLLPATEGVLKVGKRTFRKITGGNV